MAAAWIAAGAAVIGAVSSIFGSKKAGDAAKEQARKEAVAEGIVTGEKLRLSVQEEARLRGQTIAAVAASGVEVGKHSPMDVLAEQAAEYTRQRGVIKQVGATKAAAALAQGSAIASAAKWQGYAAAAGGLAGAFGALANAGIFTKAGTTPATPTVTPTVGLGSGGGPI
jgi:hypothetical protein